MIAGIIRWSLGNRFMVLLVTLIVAAWGIWSVSRTPLDALPDLSDVQVIIRTQYPGQAPRIVENQVTYPLTTTMLSIPSQLIVPLPFCSTTCHRTCTSSLPPVRIPACRWHGYGSGGS